MSPEGSRSKTHNNPPYLGDLKSPKGAVEGPEETETAVSKWPKAKKTNQPKTIYLLSVNNNKELI